MDGRRHLDQTQRAIMTSSSAAAAAPGTGAAAGGSVASPRRQSHRHNSLSRTRQPRNNLYRHNSASSMVNSSQQLMVDGQAVVPQDPMQPRSPRMKVAPPTIISSSPGPDNVGQALARLGKSIGLSVEILATVGETIGDENPEIRGDMLDACRDSRAVSLGLDKLCESFSLQVQSSQTITNPAAANGQGQPGGTVANPASSVVVTTSSGTVIANDSSGDLEALVRTLRRLLTAVTRILLLADNVVVKQLLMGGDQQPANPTASDQVMLPEDKSMSTMHHFTEFVKAFCDFGSDMIHLVKMTTSKSVLKLIPLSFLKKKINRWRSQFKVDQYDFKSQANLEPNLLSLWKESCSHTRKPLYLCQT